MKLSIITIHYNNALGLELTMQSVISQLFTDFEYLLTCSGFIGGCWVSSDPKATIIKKI